MKQLVKFFNNPYGLFVLLSLLSYGAYALENDSQEPVTIQADSAKINNKAKQGVYEGHVRIDQGTTHITASFATTLLGEDNKLLEATASGDTQEQVHYWTLSNVEEPVMHAYADFMEYKAEENKIYLVGHAVVSQGADSYAAPHIEYDITHEQVISRASDDGRTTIIIHPNSDD